MNTPQQSQLPIASDPTGQALHPFYADYDRYLNYRSHMDAEGDEFSIDFVKIFWLVVHYRLLIAAIVFVSVICALLVAFLQTPYYRATAQVEIQSESAKVLQDLDVMANSSDFRIYETAREKMRSRDLARRVVFELNLADQAEFIAPAPVFSISNIFAKAFGVTSNNSIEELTPEERSKMAVKIVRENLGTTLERNTSILNVSFSHPHPKFAERVTNQIVMSYIDQNVDKRSETSKLAKQFITEQVLETKQKLQDSERELVAYAERAGISATGGENSLISQNISELNKTLAESIHERLKIERLIQQILEGNAGTLPEVFKSESIQKTKQKIAELSAEYQQKLSTFKPGFPEMQRLRLQIRELQKQVQLEVNAIAKSTQIQFDQAVAKEEAIRQEVAELEKKQTEFQKKNIQYTILKREVDSNRLQYESLISKLNDVGVGSQLRSSNVSVVDRAIQPDFPYSPNKKLYLLVGLAMGMLLSGGLIFVFELINNTFSVPDQIERDLNLPVLGIVPKVAPEKIDEELELPNSAIAEAYRTLRTSLQFSGLDSDHKMLAITSSEPSEGKSLTSKRIGEEFANLGKKVLLIDADLRKPRQHRAFNADNNMGLSNLLANVVQPEKVNAIFRATHHPNLTLITAGTIPPNPPDFLVSQKMGLLLHFCKKRYDLVIIDCPPVIGLADAPIITRQTDATLLVVSAKQATRKSAMNAVKRLRASGANLIGATMSKFEVQKFDYNYSYRYMQSNYYQYEAEDGDKLKLENHRKKDDAGAFKISNPFERAVQTFSRLVQKFR